MFSLICIFHYAQQQRHTAIVPRENIPETNKKMLWDIDYNIPGQTVKF